jgi:hypothetical protein
MNKIKELSFDTHVDETKNEVRIVFKGFKNETEAEKFADWVHGELTTIFEEMNQQVLAEIEKDEPTRH